MNRCIFQASRIGYLKGIRYVCLYLFLTFSTLLTAQKTSTIHFAILLENAPLTLHKNYYLASIDDSLQIETFRFYISDIQLFQGDKKVYELEKKHHLIDAGTPASQSLELPGHLKFNIIKYHLGIDSLTNVSGAFGGDLDPTNGMYWTWQSGYINFKLEGKSPVCPTRKNQFVFHLGGYAFPNATLQTITLKLPKKKRKKHETVTIQVDIANFLEQIDLTKQYQIMALGEEAVELSREAAGIFEASLSFRAFFLSF